MQDFIGNQARGFKICDEDKSCMHTYKFWCLPVHLVVETTFFNLLEREGHGLKRLVNIWSAGVFISFKHP
jgi:hypothetical protein